MVSADKKQEHHCISPRPASSSNNFMFIFIFSRISWSQIFSPTESTNWNRLLKMHTTRHRGHLCVLHDQLDFPSVRNSYREQEGCRDSCCLHICMDLDQQVFEAESLEVPSQKDCCKTLRYWTADRLTRRGLPHPERCPLCDQVDETIDHLLVSCVFTQQVWFRLLQSVGLHILAPQPDETSFDDWWEKASAWSVWNHHNHCMFDGVQPDLNGVYNVIREELRLWPTKGGKYIKDQG
uniref:Reverse transcriptase zinc-binding domain-containing protein n=1 Tax=Setaria italica TaxID=4555 RepID=K3Y117_SETIT